MSRSRTSTRTGTTAGTPAGTTATAPDPDASGEAGRGDRRVAPGAPIRSGGILRRVAGDWRSGLSGLSAGIMQLMWPHLGRGVEEHSAFFSEPWDRIYRSVPQIWATILDDDADDKGLVIRDLHRDIKGRDEHGARYHALDPDTFWWAHATFTWEMFQTYDRWDHRPFVGWVFGATREDLYQQTVTWYRRYGVSDRPVPASRRAFDRRFDEILRNELELTPSASRAIDLALATKGNASVDLEGFRNEVNRTMAIGCLPSVVRERFGIPWDRGDEARLQALMLLVRNLGLAVPPRLIRKRYLGIIENMAEMANPRPEG